MTVDQLQGTNYSNQQKSNAADSLLIKKAESLGITIPYKEDGSVDLITLRNKINKAQWENENEEASLAEGDEFVESNSVATDTAENIKKAENYKDTISSEYKKASSKYKKYMNFNSGITSKEAELEKLWKDVKESEFRLTKTGTSNQTVIEGLSSFIQKITGAVEATKEYQASEAASSQNSLGAEQDNLSILGNNPFMKSALKTAELKLEGVIA